MRTLGLESDAVRTFRVPLERRMTPTVESIWNEFAERLGQFIRSRVSDRAAAEDILQDVFLKVQKKLGQLDDPSKLQSWLYLIARNAIIDYYRAKKQTTEIPDSLPAEDHANHDPEIEGLKTAFRRMVYSLPDPYRDAIVLTEFEGLTQKQLAERLDISLSGAKSRVQRGRAQLKAMLLDCCQFEFDRRGSVIDCNPREKSSCPECS
jgi:RNA polymerase sigma-70 factor, ECF subfamily